MPPLTEPYRVLVVDDSSISRQALTAALESDPRLRVVGEAKTGEEAVALVGSLRPQLVTMDLQMPGMGGLRAIEVIMRDCPTPIVVISERSSTAGTDLNYEAMSRGALELVPKSSVFGVSPTHVRRFAERLRCLVEEGLERGVVAGPTPTIPLSGERPLLVGIGASTGGPRALARLLSELPRSFPLPIAVVQHMAEDFFDSFLRFLSDASSRAVEEAKSGTVMQPGMVYVAPPRQELFVKEHLVVKLLPPPPESLISPSVDSLFFSMATALKGRGVGVLLTGMGDDGAQGLLRMRRMGARTLVQSRESCAVFGMPRAAIELGAAETVLALEAMAPTIIDCARGLTPLPARAPAPLMTPAPSSRRRVLVVDDDAKALASTRQALEIGGYEVHTVDNPILVAAVLRRTPMDLVLLEPELATMKGAAVMETLRKHGFGSVPVFLWSALEEAPLGDRAKECGALGFLRKAHPEALLHEVNSFLGGPERRHS